MITVTVRLQHNISLSEEEDSKYLRWIAVNIFTKGFSLFGTLRSLPWCCWCELGTCAILIQNSKHIWKWLMVYTFPPTYPLLPSKWWKSQQEGPAWPRRPWLGPVSSWNMFPIKFTSNTLLTIRSEWVSWLGSHNEVFQNCLLVVVQDDATGARGSSPPSPHRDPDAEEVTGWTDQHLLPSQVLRLT